MSFLKRLAAFTAALLFTGCICITALGQDANIIYTGNSGNIIFEPGSEYSPTDLFPNFKDVMPGDSLSQKITVKNNADNSVDVKIYMRSLGSTSKEYDDFLNELLLTVTPETNTPLFEAAANETAGLTNWVLLGTLYSGGELDLNVKLDVPVTLDNMFQERIGYIKWQFATVEYPVHNDNPKTGDDTNIGLWIGLAGGSVLMIAILLFLLFRRKKDEEDECQAEKQ